MEEKFKNLAPMIDLADEINHWIELDVEKARRHKGLRHTFVTDTLDQMTR